MSRAESIITSRQNPRIKDLVRLRQRRHRDEQGLFLIEGYRALRRAQDNRHPLKELYICPNLYLGENEGRIVESARADGVEIIEVNEAVFQKIAYRDRPEGLLAVAPQLQRSLNDLSLDEHSLLVVGEAIEKPGNLGTMLRSADAAGAAGLVICDACTDIFNPNVVCASVGTLFTVPLAETSSAAFIDWCVQENITIIATTPHTDSNYTDIDMTGRVAVVMGTEQYGLTDIWLQAPTVQTARIPMYGQADSLNVATATTLVLFEAVRQRRAAGILTDPGHSEGGIKPYHA